MSKKRPVGKKRTVTLPANSFRLATAGSYTTQAIFGFHPYSDEWSHTSGALIYWRGRLVLPYELLKCHDGQSSVLTGGNAVIDIDGINPTHDKQTFVQEVFRWHIGHVKAWLSDQLVMMWKDFQDRVKVSLPVLRNRVKEAQNYNEKYGRRWIQCDACRHWRYVSCEAVTDTTLLEQGWKCPGGCVSQDDTLDTILVQDAQDQYHTKALAPSRQRQRVKPEPGVLRRHLRWHALPQGGSVGKRRSSPYPSSGAATDKAAPRADVQGERPQAAIPRQ